jgi:hypothetical protein
LACAYAIDARCIFAGANKLATNNSALASAVNVARVRFFSIIQLPRVPHIGAIRAACGTAIKQWMVRGTVAGMPWAWREDVPSVL